MKHWLCQGRSLVVPVGSVLGGTPELSNSHRTDMEHMGSPHKSNSLRIMLLYKRSSFQVWHAVLILQVLYHKDSVTCHVQILNQSPSQCCNRPISVGSSSEFCEREKGWDIPSLAAKIPSPPEITRFAERPAGDARGMLRGYGQPE